MGSSVRLGGFRAGVLAPARAGFGPFGSRFSRFSACYLAGGQAIVDPCVTREDLDHDPRPDAPAVVTAMRASGWRVEPPRRVRT